MTFGITNKSCIVVFDKGEQIGAIAKEDDKSPWTFKSNQALAMFEYQITAISQFMRMLK